MKPLRLLLGIFIIFSWACSSQPTIGIKVDFEDRRGLRKNLSQAKIEIFSDSLLQYTKKSHYSSGLSLADLLIKMLKNTELDQASHDDLVLQMSSFEKIQHSEFFDFFEEPIKQSKLFQSIKINATGKHLVNVENDSFFSKLDGFVSLNQETEKGHLILINNTEIGYLLNTSSLNSELKGTITKVKAINPVGDPFILKLNDSEPSYPSLFIDASSLYNIQFDQSMTKLTEINKKDIAPLLGSNNPK